MSLQHSPKIVTNGLVLALDAANTKSYPGSGTVWTDLSGNNNNFTLTATTFSSNFGGEIQTNSATPITNTSKITSNTNCTVQMWMRINNDNTGVLFGGVDPNNTYYGAYNSGTGTFYESVSTSNSYVINSIPFSGDPKTANINNQYYLFEIRNVNLSGTSGAGTNWSSYTFASNVIGATAMILLYNRVITTAESLQNFNATRGRFGL
jgi:hypothetical protein